MTKREPNSIVENREGGERLNAGGNCVCKTRFGACYQRSAGRWACLVGHSIFVILFCALSLLAGTGRALASVPSGPKMASWYGEEHRGRLMANGKRFNPDKLTAASWFYPLGTKVRVTLHATSRQPRSVIVKITDRGPAKELVRDGRIIDLTLAAFRQLASPDLGLIGVTVEKVK